MQACFAGESFELSFDIRDPKDEEREVDSGEFEVYGPDGTLLSSGILSIRSDGHMAAFRFTSDVIGMHRIVIKWRMGADAWMQPHLLDVESVTG